MIFKTKNIKKIVSFDGFGAEFQKIYFALEGILSSSNTIYFAILKWIFDI